MKNYLLTICLLICTLILHAQDESPTRTFILGGSFNFGTQSNYYPGPLIDIGSGGGVFIPNNTDDAKSTNFSMRPTIGKQVTEKLLIGLSLQYRTTNSTSTVVTTFPQPLVFDYKTKGSEYSIGFFTRHSFMPGNRFDFFLQPFAQYSIVNDDTFVDDVISSEEEATYFSAGSELGVLYNISDRFRATTRFGGLRYVTGSWEEVGTDEGNDFNSFGLNFNLSTIYFGIELKL